VLHLDSNTKVKLFIGYATAYESFRQVWAENSKLTSLKELESLDQERGCKLSFAAHMVRDLITGLRKDRNLSQRLACIQGEVTQMERVGDAWQLSIGKNAETLFSRKVILATGSRPRELKPLCSQSPQYITLDQVLAAEPLSSLFSPEDTVAVLGSSHSAMLVLKVLHEAPEDARPKKVLNFFRSSLKFAQYLPDGRIQHDNTGLKGEVAEWAREMLVDVPVGQVKSVQLNGLLERYNLGAGDEKDIYEECLAQATKVISAVGFDRNNLPSIHFDGHTNDDLTYDENGQIMACEDSSLVPGVFGLGIAFPARVIDVDGKPEMAVGLWKFIKQVNEVVPRVIQHP